MPSNFTHLGHYAFISGKQIFDKKKNWKDNNKQPHRDNVAEVLKDPVVYFTIAITTDLAPRVLIDGIMTEWETYSGGKLQVMDLQSHESKMMFVLYFVYRDTPFYIIKKTMGDILCEAKEIMFWQQMLPEDSALDSPPASPEISIRAQVPRLKGVDTSGYDKLPYHVRENRKAIHIEAKPGDEQELKDLFQFAKEQNLVFLRLHHKPRYGMH